MDDGGWDQREAEAEAVGADDGGTCGRWKPASVNRISRLGTVGHGAEKGGSLG